jgi:hypothetical protein
MKALLALLRDWWDAPPIAGCYVCGEVWTHRRCCKFHSQGGGSK